MLRPTNAVPCCAMCSGVQPLRCAANHPHLVSRTTFDKMCTESHLFITVKCHWPKLRNTKIKIGDSLRTPDLSLGSKFSVILSRCWLSPAGSALVARQTPVHTPNLWPSLVTDEDRPFMSEALAEPCSYLWTRLGVGAYFSLVLASQDPAGGWAVKLECYR